MVAILEKTGSLSNPVVLKEVGSGLDDRRKECSRLIEMVERGEVGRVFVRHKDRLARFGVDTIVKVAELNGAKIVVVEE